jgi:signal transduction histidine kinase
MIRLQRLTSHLSRSMSEDEVASTLVDEGCEALGARNAALWRLDEVGQSMGLLRARNIPEHALAKILRLTIDRDRPVGEAVATGEPVWLRSRNEYLARYPASAARAIELDPRLDGGDFAIAALPLVIEGRVLGVLSMTFDGAREFDDNERAFLELLAWHCAHGFERARLHAIERAARREQEIAQERAVFLAKASGLLGSSLDYEETLRNVARLAVPRMADWCAVDLADAGDNTFRLVTVAHVDPDRVAFATELRRKFPPDPDADTGVAGVIRNGKAEIYPDITDELLVATARSEEHLAMARELGLRSAMIAPIRDREGVLGAITFVIAGTDRRYTPEDLMMAEQLGERIGAAIANAKLYEESRRAVVLRDEFLSIAGHELRTPLAAISLHLQSMLRSPDEMSMTRIRERIHKLIGQSDRLAALIEDLLDVTKLMSGRVELEPRDLDLGGVVKQCAERMRDEFDRAATPLQLRLASVRGRWDRARIDQITTNLLSNALKYGRGQPVSVEVSVDDEIASLAVSDRGIGIAPEDQARIFERFERAVSSRNFGGFGLGLWIVRQLVEAHGGTIGVTSQLGEGATFTVTLPMVSAPVR